MKQVVPFLLLGLTAGCGVSSSFTVAVPPATKQITFAAKDGGKVYADFYLAGQKPAKAVVLMFHQARSSAAEYYPIAPRVKKLGFDCLAVDQRSGGDMYASNRTAKGYPSDPGYLAAYADLQGALDWARAQKYAKIVIWGSSYSASLCLRLASENADVKTVVAFSPGEYFDDKAAVGHWLGKVKVPSLLTCTDAESSAVDAMVSAAKTTMPPPQVVHGPEFIHGSSTLRTDKNPDGAEKCWAKVEPFLKSALSK